MRLSPSRAVAGALVLLVFAGCDATAPEATADATTSAAAAAATAKGAIVFNPGQGPGGECGSYDGTYATENLTAVLTPSGQSVLSCRFSGLDQIDRVEQVEGFACFVLGGTTTNSFWRRTPGGTAILRCISDIS